MLSIHVTNDFNEGAVNQLGSMQPRFLDSKAIDGLPEINSRLHSTRLAGNQFGSDPFSGEPGYSHHFMPAGVAFYQLKPVARAIQTRG